MLIRRVVLALLLLAPALFPQNAAEERIWKDFLQWYRTQAADTPDPQKAYIEYLKSSGLPEAAAKDRAALIRKLVPRYQEDFGSVYFDKTYSSTKPAFNTQPNALLTEVVRDLKPGRALDVHMGQGRNAIFLARKGWDVTGFDLSAEGIRVAQQAAEKAGVKINALVRRHQEFDFGKTQWDLVVMAYTWVPLNSVYIQKICDSLRPGGLLVFEHLLDESGSASWSPKINQLPTVFSSLRILRYEDRKARADWARTDAQIARLVAQKR